MDIVGRAARNIFVSGNHAIGHKLFCEILQIVPLGNFGIKEIDLLILLTEIFISEGVRPEIH